MNSDEANELNEKLDRIENLIHDLATRTGNLEQLIGSGPYNIRRSGAPPVMGAPNQPQQPQPSPVAVEAPEAPARPPASAPHIPTQPAYRQVNAPDFPQKEVTFSSAEKPKGDGASVDEAEYKIGMNVLLKGGAIIVILGMLYLVALGITRGWITLTTQFIGEIALCLTFIGIGHWKRKEREEFGQILTGIGSCGLYFSIAGAHAYKNLYEAEVVVGLFLVLSLANLAYSFWNSSRAFLLIGMIGGLIGSVLPMKEDRTILTTVLHFLVILPSAAIIIRNRWSALAVVMSLVSSAALIPVFFSHEPWLTRIIVMYGAAAISCFVYAKTFEKQSWDPQAVFIPFAASSAAIGGLLLAHIAVRNVTGSTNPAHGSYQVLFLSAILGALAYYFRADKLIWQVFAVTAVAISAILAPIGLERTPEAFTFLALSLPLAYAAIRWKSIALSTLAWIVFGLGLTAYVAFWSTDIFNPKAETAFLLFAMVCAGFHSWVTNKQGQKSENASIVASLLCLPMTLRMSDLWITPVWGHNTSRGMLVGFAFFAVVSLAVSVRNKWVGFAYFGALGILFAGFSFIAGAPYHAGEETALLLFFAALLVGFSTVTSKLGQKTENAAILASLLCLPMILRLSELWITPVWGHNTSRGMLAGFAFFTVISLAISARYKWVGFVFFGALGILSAGFSFIAGAPYQAGEETALLLFFAALLVGFSAVTSSVQSEAIPRQIGAPAVLITLLIVRLSTILLDAFPMSEAAPAAIGFVVSAFLWAVISRRYNWMGTIGAGWMAAILGGLCAFPSQEMLTYMDGGVRSSIPPSTPFALDLAILAASQFAIIAMAFATKPRAKKSREIEVLSALLIIPMWTRLCHLALTELTGMSSDASISAAWIAYACIMIAIGFRFKIQALRYFSFVVFGVTVGKVLLFDLSGLDPGIRVVILLALGVAMIVGGYLYIRTKSDQDVRSPEPESDN